MPGYRKISSELKAKAALEALKDEEAISTIASKYRIDPKTLRDWVKKLKENSASVFDSKIEEEHKEKLRQKENQIKELKNLIGEQTVMIDWVKKKYREAGFQWENEPHGW
jgi:transposase-like protein